MKRFNYVYIITNLINGKQYIGDHSTNNLDDGYMGSGLLLKKAYNKYTKKSFNKKILEEFNSREDAFNAQEKWINEYDTLIPNGYNISPKGGNRVPGCHSEETLKKLRKPKSEETKLKISQALKGREGNNKGKKFDDSWRKNISESHKGRSKENHPMFGKTHSDETKDKIRKAHENKVHSEETKEKMRKSHMGKESPNKGKPQTDEWRKKIGQSLLGRKRGPYKKSPTKKSNNS